MAKLKTKVTEDSIDTYIENIANEQKREDCKALLKIISSVTKETPKLWSNNTVGFGTFHYKSERSAQQGEWFTTGFSARKDNITIYIIPGFGNYKPIMQKLGKHKTSSGSCLLINKLEDIHVPVLKELIKAAVADMKKKYPKS